MAGPQTRGSDKFEKEMENLDEEKSFFKHISPVKQYEFNNDKINSTMDLVAEAKALWRSENEGRVLHENRVKLEKLFAEALQVE
jgi:hypothetical protein